MTTNNSTIKAIDELSKILYKIIEAGEEKNVTEENRKIALEDTFKLLNKTLEIIQNSQDLTRINIYQNIYFKAIRKINKKFKYPLIKINDNLFRVYVISLFKNKNLDNILTNITGWKVEDLEKEKITYDMKLILLSMIHINDEEVKSDEEVKNN